MQANIKKLLCFLLTVILLAIWLMVFSSLVQIQLLSTNVKEDELKASLLHYKSILYYTILFSIAPFILYFLWQQVKLFLQGEKIQGVLNVTGCLVLALLLKLQIKAYLQLLQSDSANHNHSFLNSPAFSKAYAGYYIAAAMVVIAFVVHFIYRKKLPTT